MFAVVTFGQIKGIYIDMAKLIGTFIRSFTANAPEKIKCVG